MSTEEKAPVIPKTVNDYVCMDCDLPAVYFFSHNPVEKGTHFPNRVYACETHGQVDMSLNPEWDQCTFEEFEVWRVLNE
jgi:hypothetical protein